MMAYPKAKKAIIISAMYQPKTLDVLKGNDVFIGTSQVSVSKFPRHMQMIELAKLR